jgi:hypothetical protein
MSSQPQRPKGIGAKRKGLLLPIVAVIGLLGVSQANPLPPLFTPLGGGSPPTYGFFIDDPAFVYDAGTQVFTTARHVFNLGTPGFGPGELTFSEPAMIDRTGHVLHGGLVQWIGAIPALGIPEGTLLFRGRITAITIFDLGPFGGESPDPRLQMLIHTDFSHPAVGLGPTVGYSTFVPSVMPPPTDFDAFFEDPFAASFILDTTSTQTLFNVLGVPEPVAIDIKPGGNPNSVNPRSKGIIPVAILTTDAFDATTVDPATVMFGPSGAGIGQRSIGFEDVDGDGDLDLVLRFPTPDTGIACGDTDAHLSGSTFGGSWIAGFDKIVTIGCN